MNIIFRDFENDPNFTIETCVKKDDPTTFCITISTREGTERIHLDKSTAIRFQRELKKQISFIEPF